MEILAISCLLIAGAIFSIMAQSMRARMQTERGVQALRQWASENHYKLISFEQKYYRLGPFRIFSHTSTCVFQVKILDTNSMIRKGRVKIGNWLGDLPDDVQVIWNDEKRDFQWW